MCLIFGRAVTLMSHFVIIFGKWKRMSFGASLGIVHMRGNGTSLKQQGDPAFSLDYY